MKIPNMAPTLQEYVSTLPEEEQSSYLLDVLMSASKTVDDKGRYLHWDKLQYVPLPEDIATPLEYWHKIKAARNAARKETVFNDKFGTPFAYVEFDKLNELKDWVLENAAGVLDAPDQIKNQSTKSTYLISSIIEESINSSQMEGASTTRRVAKDMLRSGRDPKDLSETMIFNNYKVMMFIRELLKDGDIKLTPKIVLKLHDIVTEDTLTGKDEGKGGEYRSSDDDIVVCDPKSDEILHIPPTAGELKDRLQLICDFVNGESDNEGSYMPPVLRAIITHFMIGYDHPFVEGNGRTARTLFYWVMMKHNYWLMEYVSISSVIKRKQKEYLKAFVHTESDANDLTYFVLQQLEVIREAIKDFHKHVARQVQRDQDVLEMFKCSDLKKDLNTRQIALIRNALGNPGNTYTIQSHQNSHACSREAARKDLLKLSDTYELLQKYKDGKTLVFVAPRDLSDRVKR
ncbi:MAG: Fic family protein [Pseudomonadales bacterium]